MFLRLHVLIIYFLQYSKLDGVLPCLTLVLGQYINTISCMQKYIGHYNMAIMEKYGIVQLQGGSMKLLTTQMIKISKR